MISASATSYSEGWDDGPRSEKMAAQCPVSSGVNDWGKKVSPPLPLGVLGLLEPVFNQQCLFQSYKTVAKPRRPLLAFRFDSM